MKKFFTHALLAFLLVAGRHSLAQIVIDISTGIQNNTPNTPIPVNSSVPYNHIDDTWSVGYAPWGLLNPNPPVPAAFQSAAISNRVALTNECNPPSWTVPSHAGSEWISPNVDAQGKYIDAVRGDYFYKMTFNYCQSTMPCSAPSSIISAVMNINYLAMDGDFNEILVNGVPYYTGGIPSTNTPFTSLSYVNNFSFSIPINVTGQNVIMIVFNNAGSLCGNYYNDGVFRKPTGFEMQGNITIETTFDYSLKDKDGNIKNTFCVGEDVFLDGSNLKADGYFMELWPLNGTSALSAQGISGWATGAPNWVNITELFENDYENPITFQPGTTYTIRYGMYTNCGLVYGRKNFTYICCDNAPDASFGLTNTKNGTKLEGSNSVNGHHDWKIYSVSSVNGGPNTLIGNSTNQKFSLDVTGSCFYVTHKLTTVCGESCEGRRFCNFSCGEKSCNLGAPYGLTYNSTTKTLAWVAVPGASSYIIEIILNDPACCQAQGDVGSGGGGIISIGNVKTIPVPNNSYILNPGVDLNFDGDPCFSWKVKVVCSDGSTTSSGSICSNSLPSDPNNDPDNQNGRMAFSNASDGNKEGVKNAKITMSLYPNPSKGMVSMEVNVSSDIEFSVDVFDRTGSKVKSIENLRTIDKKSNIKWEAESFGKGIYLVKILTSDNQIISGKLIIQ